MADDPEELPLPEAETGTRLRASIHVVRGSFVGDADPPLALGPGDIVLVLRAHEREAPGETRAPADPRIARALAQLEARLSEPWTVATLAKAAGLSRAAFARRFLSEMGVPPLRYLAELRMLHAARLLAEGDASLAGIAAEIGYESEFAFSRAFKRHTGEAPGVYRRRVRAERTQTRASCLRAAA